MRIAIFSSYFAPAHLAGGPVQSLCALVMAAPREFHVLVVTTNGDHGVDEMLPVPTDVWTKWNHADVLYASRGVLPLMRTMQAVARRKPQYLYLNSLFDVRYSLVPLILARIGIIRDARVLIAPRGELNRGALALKSKKKRVFLAAYRVLGLSRRVTWHATNESEADDIRRLFGPSEVLVRQNDTLLPEFATVRSGRTPGACRLVFASRLSKKKRLDLLLRALLLVDEPFSLRVVGAFDDPEYERYCREIAAHPCLRHRVSFVGPQSRDRLLEELKMADAFVFPTAGENFGHVIAEALSVSCPVIVSRHTPWTPLIESGGGAVVYDDRAAAFGDEIASFVRSGEPRWSEAAKLAGLSYERWLKERDSKHLFEMLDPR